MPANSHELQMAKHQEFIGFPRFRSSESRTNPHFFNVNIAQTRSQPIAQRYATVLLSLIGVND
jgi:hypothetical protein